MRESAKNKRRQSMGDRAQSIQAILAQIDELAPNRKSNQANWSSLHQALASAASRSPDTQNNPGVIKALLKFTSDFNDYTEFSSLSQFYSMGIGAQHALFIAALSLVCERNGNFVQSLYYFNEGFEHRSQPLNFMQSTFDQFKKRMNSRLRKTRSMILGSLHDISYEYNGTLICKDGRGHPISPEIEFLQAIGFDPLSEKLNDSSKSFGEKSREKPGYNASLLLGADGKDTSFEISRLESMGIDFVAKRKEAAPPKKRKPLQEIKPTDFPVPPQADFAPREPEIKPKSILKKPSSGSGQPKQKVQIGPIASDITEEKRRVPTPITKRVLSVGETITIGSKKMRIERKLGESAFLCEFETKSYVVKPPAPECPLFNPQKKEMFCLGKRKVSEYYVTHFQKFGDLRSLVDICHARPRGTEEVVAQFYLLQLVRILQSLESNELTHGSIDEEHLLLRTAPEELPSFDDGLIWGKVGLSLCRCDKMVRLEQGKDRRQVASLFHFLCTKTQMDGRASECPKMWNQAIWKSAFDALMGQGSLSPLEASLASELKAKGMQLRSSLSRLFVKLFLPQDQ